MRAITEEDPRHQKQAGKQAGKRYANLSHPAPLSQRRCDRMVGLLLAATVAPLLLLLARWRVMVEARRPFG